MTARGSVVDLRKQIGAYSARRGRFELIEVPPLNYLMIDGQGDPNTARRYQEAIATLYPVAYRLKFFSKREFGCDHEIMPLEALWWADDLAAFTHRRNKSQWRWTVMIMLPDWILPAHVDAARTALAGKAPLSDAVRVERLDERLAIQTLHVGPYDDEGPVLERMHRDIGEQGLRMTGRHHEVYLNDARRTAPERLRTILRQPVVREHAG